jgi:uncharacterized membrane protein
MVPVKPIEQSVSIDISAPPERVWAVLSDIERWREWTATVTEIRRLDDGPLRIGSRAKVSQPKLPTTEYAVTEIELDRSFTWVSTGPGVRVTARHALEPLPSGGTRVRLAVEQAGWLGSVMGRFYRGLTERYLATEAAGLKARSEA